MSHGHDDFESEPVPGLPALLPEGEEIKWQGAPDQGAVAKNVLHSNKIAIYFAIVAIWQFSTTLYDGGSIAEGLAKSGFMIVLGLIVLTTIWLFARAIERTTVYTITNKRVVMRFGVALPVTYNFPFKQMLSADVKTAGNDTGTIAMGMAEHSKMSWAIMWPHARPWKFAKPEPALRQIKDIQHVSQILSRQLNAYHKQQYVHSEIDKETQQLAPEVRELQGQQA